MLEESNEPTSTKSMHKNSQDTPASKAKEGKSEHKVHKIYSFGKFNTNG